MLYYLHTPKGVAELELWGLATGFGGLAKLAPRRAPPPLPKGE